MFQVESIQVVSKGGIILCCKYFKNVREIFKSSKLLVLSSEIDGKNETPISLFNKLCNKRKSYLLESAEGTKKWSQYSYIGRNPFMEVKCNGNKVYISSKDKVTEKTGNPLDIIRKLIKEYEMPLQDNMPDFIGGAVGYVGYDVIRSYEELKSINFDDIKMPDIHLFFMEEIIIYDHLNKKTMVVINLPISSNEENLKKQGIKKLNNIKDEILNNNYVLRDNNSTNSEGFSYMSNVAKEDFINNVIRAKEYIKAGDIFQVVLSQRLQVETDIHPFKIYCTLRKINPSPYMFYIDFEGYHLVGSSPEMLVKAKGNSIETCPIAGTRPRGLNSQEDEALSNELLNDEKELAEHLMLVDLSRNDIGKVSKFGTVQLTNYMDVQRYSHVMHIVSNVIGELRDDYDMFDSLISCLPAGTVSGAPKIRAMEIIDELENNKRGVYAGAVGYIGLNGNMDTCIAIRTIVFKDNKAYIQAGAGIVADSDPENEYLETLRKATALMEAIKITKEDLA